MNTILAIGAHPDDIEFGCGALLIKEVRLGNRVQMACLSLGEAGTSGTPEIRKQETQTAAEHMGATVEFLDFGGDCHIEPSFLNKIRIARLIREVKPNIVLAPQTIPNQHPDHANVGIIVRDACRFARYGGLGELQELPRHIIDALFYFSVTGVGFGDCMPDLIVDISDVMDDWRETMEMHETQVSSRQYVDFILSRARMFGLMSHVEYGLSLWSDDPVVVDSISCLEKTSRHF